MKRIAMGEKKDSGHFNDAWSVLLKSRYPNTGKAFSTEELISEAGIFIVGGTDTTTTCTVSTIFYLLRNPSTLERLTKEVREAFPTQSGSSECPIQFADPRLQKITYILACMDEALRLSPPLPTILRREVGPGGIVVDGEVFPEGTDLGVPHYSLHRNEEAFPEPLSYKPERWMHEDTDGESKEGKSSAEQYKAGVGYGPCFTPFGLGRYSCIGRHLAYQEVSYILAHIVWQFDLRFEPGSTLGGGHSSRSRGRRNSDEFQIFCRFVAQQDGPLVQFRQRADF